MDKILTAADDILHVFDETAEWVDRDKGLVVKILKELVEEKSDLARKKTLKQIYKDLGVIK